MGQRSHAEPDPAYTPSMIMQQQQQPIHQCRPSNSFGNESSNAIDVPEIACLRSPTPSSSASKLRPNPHEFFNPTTQKHEIPGIIPSSPAPSSSASNLPKSFRPPPVTAFYATINNKKLPSVASKNSHASCSSSSSSTLRGSRISQMDDIPLTEFRKKGIVESDDDNSSTTRLIKALDSELIAKQRKRVCICVLSVVSFLLISGFGAVLFVWKVLMPHMIQNAFSNMNLAGGGGWSGNGGGAAMFLGIRLLRVDAFTANGLVFDIIATKGGFAVPLGASLDVAAGSRWDFDVSRDSTLWLNALQIDSFPTSISLTDNIITLNANMVDMVVTNSSVLSEIVRLSSSGNSMNSDSISSIMMRLSILADITVAGIFPVPQLLLQNTFALSDMVGSGATPQSTISSDQASNSLIDSVTADAVVKVAPGVLGTGVTLHINNSMADGSNAGSPFQFPTLHNVTVAFVVGQSSGRRVALMKLPYLGVAIGDISLHIPIEVDSLIQKKGNSNFTSDVAEYLISAASSALLSEGQIGLVGWNITSISGEIQVPLWMRQVALALKVELARGSSGVFAGLLGELVLQLV